MLEFLSWVADHRRTYDEVMETWQSHCPRQTIWEDAIIEGLVEVDKQSNDHEVMLTPRAEAILMKQTLAAMNKPINCRRHVPR